MADVTQILEKIAAGDSAAANDLLPLVYEELRKVASSKMAKERPGQTLEPTALVHEAFLRLVPSAITGTRWPAWVLATTKASNGSLRRCELDLPKSTTRRFAIG